MFPNKKSNECERGNTIIEFVSFLTLFFLPLISFFTLITANSVVVLREENMFREIVRIIESGDDFTQAISTARRYVSLQNSPGTLEVTCMSGSCPHRGSLFRVVWIGKKSKIQTVAEGGKWR